MQFQMKPVATIKTKTNDANAASVTVNGVTTANTTPENAKAQIDKLYGVVGKGVLVAGMTRTFVEEAID